MTTKYNLLRPFLALMALLILTHCATIDTMENAPSGRDNFKAENPVGIVGTPLTLPEATPIPTPETVIDPEVFETYPVLSPIFESHGIEELPPPVQEKFIKRYVKTTESKYRPQGTRTFCTLYFYDYYQEMGYGNLLNDIKSAPGDTMVEKAINFEQERGIIKVLWSGYEAQQLANQGWDIGVIGEYYYDTAEKLYTRHYSVVQPSKIVYDEEGNLTPYYVTGLITNRTDVNNRYGTGPFLAQTGVANGLIDFRWAYNRKLEGILQKDAQGKIRGGIIFVVFPDRDSLMDLVAMGK